MNTILLVSQDNLFFEALIQRVAPTGVSVIRADSGATALNRLKEHPFKVVVVDENLSDMTGLELIKRIVIQNPMVNCAMVSSLSPEACHEMSEGLGILMQLPPHPDATDAERLFVHLKKIAAIMVTKGGD